MKYFMLKLKADNLCPTKWSVVIFYRENIGPSQGFEIFQCGPVL